MFYKKYLVNQLNVFLVSEQINSLIKEIIYGLLRKVFPDSIWVTFSFVL